MARDGRDVELAEIAAIMRSDSGQSLICRILERTGYFSDTFSEEPLEHAYNAGQRSVGLWLVNELKEADSLVSVLRRKFENE